MTDHQAARDVKTLEPLAIIKLFKPISIIIPTYREVENIPHILQRFADFREQQQVEIEVLFLDDDSRDGSVEAVRSSGYDWAKIIVRNGTRSLSAAVIDGFRAARNTVLVCMDCDLSHPPEKIPYLVLALSSGQQFALGSRYVPGGSTDDDWGLFRWLNSRVATLLAKPLTKTRDPMSGFFAMRKSDFEKASNLNPVGYKIALELIVKCGFSNIAEIPIHFTDRVYGESKLSFKEQLKYIRHIRLLYLHKFSNAMYLIQFLFVGASGMVVNLTVLTLLSLAGVTEWLALAGGIGVSVLTNFLLNRRFTFNYARNRNPWNQLVGFVGVSAVAIIINYSSALWLHYTLLNEYRFGLQAAATIGIAAGMTFNFLGNRFIVFKKKHYSKVN